MFISCFFCVSLVTPSSSHSALFLSASSTCFLPSCWSVSSLLTNGSNTYSQCTKRLFHNRLYLPTRGLTKSINNRLYNFGSLLDSPNQQHKRRLLMSGLGVLLDNLWLLERALSVQMRIKIIYVHLYADVILL